MTGKERVLSAIRREAVDRIPWVPFVGCHGGALIGQTATNYLKSADLLVQGVGKAIELYQPDGIPVVFDLQIEAEVLGCQLNWADETPPAVCSHPLAQGMSLDQMTVPGSGDGRIPAVLEATQRLRRAHPEVALYGLIL